jgi:hypothetical protein
VGAMYQSLIGPSVYRFSPDWEVVQYLRGTGIEPGDKVAFVGNAIGNHYWAHLGRLSIVSEVGREGTEAYWSGSSDVKSKVRSLFVASGARAVVARSVPSQSLAEGWRQVPKTDYSILLLKN